MEHSHHHHHHFVFLPEMLKFTQYQPERYSFLSFFVQWVSLFFIMTFLFLFLNDVLQVQIFWACENTKEDSVNPVQENVVEQKNLKEDCKESLEES